MSNADSHTINKGGFALQARVIHALILREIITRYGRHNLGFVWLLLEPILFTLGVVGLWSITHNSHGFRLDIAPFIVTGYSCMLLWRNSYSRAIGAIEPNRTLLYHRPVKIIDVFLARILLEFIGVSASFIILVLIMTCLSLMSPPHSPLLMLIGWLQMAWFSASLGIFIGALAAQYDLVERLWHPISYFFLPFSGIFFMMDWLPSAAQEVVFWMPLIHPVEMIRAGYWGEIVVTHYSTIYITLFNLALTFLAMLAATNKKLIQTV